MGLVGRKVAQSFGFTNKEQNKHKRTQEHKNAPSGIKLHDPGFEL